MVLPEARTVWAVMMTESKRIWAVAGGGTEARFAIPAGLAFTSDGATLYVV